MQIEKHMTNATVIQLPERMLIRSKLDRPPLLGQLVARPRLIEQLDEGRNARATLIAAPAGYGKTTLALQWLSGSGIASSWIRLDQFDRNPWQFIRYLVAALHPRSGNGLQRTRALLEGRVCPPWRYVTDVLLGELAEVRERTVLVLEDYHAIDTPEVHALIERMVEVRLPAFHLLVLTRVHPPWPVMRWQTSGWLSQLRARDLSFSLAETQALFARTGGLALGHATVEFLWSRTEGWIAGLRLAQISLFKADDPHVRARQLSGTDRQIAGYLMEEVLKGQRPEFLEFLATSALLERFSAPLMDHLLGDRGQPSNARVILAEVERENLFLVALDDHRRWFRWHHLFRDLLLDHLHALFTPEFRSRVDRAAGAWLAQEGLVEEALRHWIAAGELDAAAELVGAHLHAAIAEDMSCRLLSQWLAIFSRDAIDRSLPLLVADGYCRIVRWDLAGLEAVLNKGDQLEASGPRRRGRNAHPSLRADLGAQRSFLLYWRGDIEGSLECAGRALDLRPEVGTRAWSLGTLYRAASLALMRSYPEANRHLDDAGAALGPESPNLAEVITWRVALAFYADELETCRARCRALLQLNERVPQPEFWTGYAYYVLGVVAYERNRLDEAEAWFRRLERLRYVVSSRLYQDGLLGQALVARARGDEDAVDAYCRMARVYANEVADPSSLRIIDSFDLRLAVLRGLPRPAGVGAPPPDDHQSVWLEVPTVTWAMHLVTHPAPEMRASALAFVDDALARAQRYHHQRLATVLSVLRALALEVQGQRENALDSLSETVRYAAARGLVRSFVDCGPRVKALVDEVARRSHRDAYLESLRAAFEGGATRHSPTDSSAFRSSHPLSHRERETLELLAWHMTNKEIAARLSVSPAAVKKRLESIYAKLDTRDRRGAVAKAITNGLITPPTH
jgi:LuxR family maltose regulon positive regulatory protein